MISTLVRADHVSRSFGSDASTVLAVRDATCTIGAGDRIALCGQSGSGKSTLLHLLAGLDSPNEGSISWPAIGSKLELRPGKLGVVFQSPSLIPALSVVENCALPLLLMGMDRDAAKAKALSALSALDLALLAQKLPEEISGGQAQRVSVARVLASSPQLILADEPTGQLDHITGNRVIDVLIAAADIVGAGLLVNTHDEAIAERFALHWTMSNGRLFTQNGTAS